MTMQIVGLLQFCNVSERFCLRIATIAIAIFCVDVAKTGRNGICRMNKTLI